jgi:heavy metal efflux system protein
MFFRVTGRSLRHPLLTIGILIVATGWATYHLRQLGFDIWPDVSPVQVQVLTQVRDLAPEEAEATITRPLELEFGGLPGLQETRSQTTFGISQVTLVFRPGTNLLQARQWTQERVQTALSRLPKGYSPVLAPPSDGLGEIYTYALQARHNTDRSPVEELAYLKRVQDFVVRPALRTIPGIVEVNTTGGFDRALIIEPFPQKLYQMGLDAVDLANAVEASVGVGGGAMLEPADHQTIVRSRARAQTVAEVEQIPVKLSWGALAVTTNQLATVREGTKLRLGAATLDGKEAVLGTALMLIGSNSREMAQLFHAKLREVQSYLPADIQITSLYDRSHVVDQILRTIARNLSLAVFLVAIVLLVFFRNWRAMLITILVIPIAFLFALNALSWFGVSGNLMSLGALDFGLVVDGAVVIVDNVLLRLLRQQTEIGRRLNFSERRQIITQAVREVTPPMAIGWLIILLAYLPGLLLGGVEGKMLQPLGLTALFALTAAFPLSLTLVPILCLLIKKAPAELPIGRAGTRGYLMLLDRAWRHRVIILAAALALCVFAAVMLAGLGLDFFPALDEGSTVIEVEKPVALNVEESLKWELTTETAIRRSVPECKHVYSRIGFSDIATDPQSPSQNDIYVSYRPRRQWRKIDGKTATKKQLEQKILEAIRKTVPDQELALSQPIRVRFDEMLEGVRSALAIKIFSSDAHRLEAIAGQVKDLVEKLPGTADVLLDPVGELPGLEFNADRPTLARYLVKTSEIDQNLSLALAGREVGRVDDGEQFFPIIVRLAEPLRNDVKQIVNLPIRSAEGNLMLTLGQLGKFTEVPRLNFIFHENGFRRRAVMVNIRDRDLDSFAQGAKEAIQSEVKLRPDERIELGGSYRFLQASLKELQWIVPVTLIVFYLLIAWSLRSWGRALIVYVGVPFALVGGILALVFAQMSLTLSALIGLLAVAGIAILNKLVFVHHYMKLRRGELTTKDAVILTTRNRLRPVLSTALVAMVGFVPMLLSTELGAEVQRPIALVVIGGLFSSTLLTLVILPLLLLLFEKDEVKLSTEQRASATNEASPAVGSARLLSRGGP